MITYAVFPFKASGVAPLFIPIDEKDDAAAATAAVDLLSIHRSADRVTVWREDKMIFSSPSSECAIWLAASPDRRANCPAMSLSEQACPAQCERIAIKGAFDKTGRVATYAGKPTLG